MRSYEYEKVSDAAAALDVLLEKPAFVLRCLCLSLTFFFFPVGNE